MLFLRDTCNTYEQVLLQLWESTETHRIVSAPADEVSYSFLASDLLTFALSQLDKLFEVVAEDSLELFLRHIFP